MSQTHIPADLRRAVRERAQCCCEYCGIPESTCFVAHEIDHVIAEQHGGAHSADNLALACLFCNKRKGPNLASIDPDTGDLTRLFNPRSDRWSDHFRLLSAGQIEMLSAVGRATARLLEFNLPERIVERKALLEARILSTNAS